MVIYFKSEKARRYLIEYGSVVTYRRFRKKVGSDVAYIGRGLGRIGRVIVEKIMDCNMDVRICLSHHVHVSGFNSVNKWFDECIKMDTRRREPLYGSLFRVTLDQKEYIRLHENPLEMNKLIGWKR